MTRLESNSTVFILCVCDDEGAGGVIVCGGGAGVRVPAFVGERGGDVDGEDAEGDGHVYGQQCVLRAIGHSDSVGVRSVSVPRVHVAANGLQSRLFHNQRFPFSYLSGVSEFILAFTTSSHLHSTAVCDDAKEIED